MARRETRGLVYRRLRWLWPILARPWVRRGLRVAAWGLVAVYFLFAATVLILRYAILPKVGEHQAEIEAAASRAVGLPVRIGRIEAGWDGLNPELTLSDVTIADRQGRPGFVLSKVESVLSWQSLWRLSPTLKLLVVDGPILNIRRDAAGKITIAGVDAEGESDPAVADWFLAQPHIRIRNAIIVWEDTLRQAPPLVLEDLQFGLDNRGSRHRFGISAVPPANLAARLDIRGELRGSLGEALDQLAGKVFVELQYADLAGWRAWVDYPVHLPQGRGALRVWGDWNGGQAKVTADLALEDLRIRLGPAVPELNLAVMRGRLSGRYGKGSSEIGGQRVELTTLDGLRLAPTDFHMDWRREPGSQGLTGSASANQLDLDALYRLAGHLPLDARSRELLTTHRPAGRIVDLRANWQIDGETVKQYGLRARFDRLGLAAAGYMPGASGLSGEVDANEKGGTLTLDAKDASLELPAVFPEPRLAFAEMRAKATWKKDKSGLDAKLDRLDFSSPDAAGTARGTYRYDGSGPGVIDLSAALNRADGTAVWRYMPHVVNRDTRDWLRRGIVAGKASDARLTLKGDLKDFPFRDKSKGQFLITTKAHQVKLDVAPGWPLIEKIDADLSFGIGMRIEAQRGAIFGAELGKTVVEIPDFESPEEMLLVRGSAQGPTAEFLRFIDQSPVGDRIDRFTEDMRASGKGHLDLELDMPLRRIGDTAVRGDFQFQNNQIAVIPGLPPLTQVNGRLKVTEKAVQAPEITAQVLGGPMRLSVKNEGERVHVAMAGTASAREGRKIFDTPLFEYVSGNLAWKGEVRVKKKTADFIVETNLVGVSSSLLEPLNKNAASALPLRIEKSNLAEGGDQIRVSLGKVAEAHILRRPEGHAMVVDRGAAALGEALPKMPGKGLALAIAQPQIDADAWRRLFAGDNGGASAGAVPADLPPLQMAVKTPLLRLFGRDFRDVEVNLRPRDGGWQIGLSTREALGDVFWRSGGEGWVQADLKRLAVPASAAGEGGDSRILDSLPGMDIRVAEFTIGEKRLGRLELKARNERSLWNLEALSLQNPDGALKGKAQWNSVGGHHTRLGFELTSGDIGKLLERLGYPGAVKRGSASLKGDLEWDGPLTGIHYPSLTGQMEVAAAKGQFAKVDPGLGKLLGLLSLQSLPRRLTLDFRDIFSEGFAFDSIEGKLDVKKGVMRTREDLAIDGPAARVLMKGEADLRQETQDVLVTVQPELGSVLSVGALLLAHPVVGAAAAVVSKVMQNPLNKIFSFQYHVTGNWSDPKVEKVGQSVQDVPAPAKPKEGQP